MGRFITLPGVNPPASRPKVNIVDPVLNAGSLILVEPAHPFQQWGAGVPASGAVLPNLAEESAAALYGTDEASRKPIFDISVAFSSPRGLLERSGKGGLHAIISPSDIASPSPGAAVAGTSALSAYLLANKSHKLYMSLWERETRLGTDSQMVRQSITFASTGYTANYLMQALLETYAPSTGSSNFLGGEISTPNALGPRFRYMATQAYTGSDFAGTPRTHLAVFGSHASNPFNNAVAQRGKSGSWVFYRLYMEDLTVSGLTPAQAREKDRQAYADAVTDPAGRYYGDTFTSPTTIP